jgi:hypothetical protein
VAEVGEGAADVPAQGSRADEGNAFCHRLAR